MTKKKMRCPKCEGTMVQGFVPEYSAKEAILVSWREGQPKRSFWTTTKAPRGEGLPIGAFRCEECGFLELYADAKFEAE